MRCYLCGKDLLLKEKAKGKNAHVNCVSIRAKKDYIIRKEKMRLGIPIRKVEEVEEVCYWDENLIYF